MVAPPSQEVDFDVNITNLYAAIGRSDWDSASRACRLNPIEAETWVVRKERDEDGELIASSDSDSEDDDDMGGRGSRGNIMWRFLPLHSACARDPPTSFLRDLLRAYPDAASIRDDQGMYPLHYACGNRASRAVVRQLLDAYPRAARLSDPNGMLPLHYLASWGPAEDGILETVIEAHEEGLLARDKDGATPLELAKEGPYEGWEEVADVLESAQLTMDRLSRPSRTPNLSLSTESYRLSPRSQPESPRTSRTGRSLSVNPRDRASRFLRTSASPRRLRDQELKFKYSQKPQHSHRALEDFSPRSQKSSRYRDLIEARSPRQSSAREDQLKTPRSSGRGGFGFDEDEDTGRTSRNGRCDPPNLTSHLSSNSPPNHAPSGAREPPATSHALTDPDENREVTKLLADMHRDKEAAEARATIAEESLSALQSQHEQLLSKSNNAQQYDALLELYNDAMDKLERMTQSLQQREQALHKIVTVVERREKDRSRGLRDRKEMWMDLMRREERMQQQVEKEAEEALQAQFGCANLGMALDHELREMERMRRDVDHLKMVRDDFLRDSMT